MHSLGKFSIKRSLQNSSQDTFSLLGSSVSERLGAELRRCWVSLAELLSLEDDSGFWQGASQHLQASLASEEISARAALELSALARHLLVLRRDDYEDCYARRQEVVQRLAPTRDMWQDFEGGMDMDERAMVLRDKDAGE